MTYYVYILYSKTSDIYYVGQTNDVDKRIEQHNDPHGSSYTSKHQPWILVKKIEVGKSRGDAIKIEKFIKKQKSRTFIERIVQNPIQFDSIALTNFLVINLKIKHKYLIEEE